MTLPQEFHQCVLSDFCVSSSRPVAQAYFLCLLTLLPVLLFSFGEQKGHPVPSSDSGTAVVLHDQNSLQLWPWSREDKLLCQPRFTPETRPLSSSRSESAATGQVTDMGSQEDHRPCPQTLACRPAAMTSKGKEAPLCPTKPRKHRCPHVTLRS